MSRHFGLCIGEGLRAYQRRSFDPVYGLDKRHFDALVGDDLAFVCMAGWSLDAPDQLPAGSMRSANVGGPWMHAVSRGVSLAEQRVLDAVASRLIDEMMAELRAAGEALS